MEPLKIEWKQDGARVYFEYMGTNIYFIMPEGFRIDKVHPDLIKLAEHLMFSPWHDVIGDYKFSRKRGKRTGLSFSTGVDSMAVMLLLPDDISLVYVQRHGISPTDVVQDNALRCIDFMEKNGRDTIIVKTNFELIRTNHNLTLGYSTAIGMGVPLILLADSLDLGVISYGKVFDDQFFPWGVFRNYPKEYIIRQDILESAGLLGVYPTVGCSEIITTKIVDNSIYKDYAFSCLMGKGGKQCNKCYKCFRKNLLRGKDATLTRSSVYVISKNPPKMATSLMYALKNNNIELDIVNHLMEQKTEVLEKIYSPAYDIYSDEIKKLILDSLYIKGFDVMNEEEEEITRSLNFLKDETDIKKASLGVEDEK